MAAPSTARRQSAESARSEAARWFGRGVGLTAGAVLVLTIAGGFVTAWRAVLLVFLAVLLGAALEPLVGRLRGLLPIPRGVAILAVYAAFFVGVAAIALLVVPASLTQWGDLAAAAPGALERARVWAEGLRPAERSAGIVGIIDAAQRTVTSGRPLAAGDIVAAGMTVADVLVSAVTVLALVFFWMTERARLQRFALSFLPAGRRPEVRDAWNDAEARLGGWVRGQLLLMGVIGIMAATLCWLLGLPSPLLLGLLAGFAEIVPMVGPAIGAIPAIAVAAVLRPEVLVLVIVGYLLIHAFEGNVLVPIVMGNVAGISPFLVIASLLVGGAVDGVRGALIAVPIAAAAEVVLERLQDRREPVTPTAEPSSTEPSTADARDPHAPVGAV